VYFIYNNIITIIICDAWIIYSTKISNLRIEFIRERYKVSNRFATNSVKSFLGKIAGCWQVDAYVIIYNTTINVDIIRNVHKIY
jgi:hypothetical protein